MLKTLMALQSDTALRVVFKPNLGDAIPDAALLLEGMPQQWAFICLPFELENGEETKKRHGQGQAVSYLHLALGARKVSEKECCEGFAVFTNLYEVIVIYHRATLDVKTGELIFKHWATKELPLFPEKFPSAALPAQVPDGFVALLSLLHAPAARLASPLATFPDLVKDEQENFSTLLSWKGGTQVWRAKDKSSVLKIALTAERRDQLAQELRVISHLASFGSPLPPWRATFVSPSALKLRPVGTCTLSVRLLFILNLCIEPHLAIGT